MRSLIRFTKMHGSGNDFVVVDGVSQQFQVTPSLVQQLSDPHTGIGFDQLLLLEPPAQTNADFLYRIFNPNGSEVAQCGNGARCIARFAFDAGLIGNKNIAMQTINGRLEMQLQKGGQVRVNMGRPKFFPKDIPTTSQPIKNGLHQLPFGENHQGAILGLGNPHCVVQTQALESVPLEKWAQQCHDSGLFPEGINLSAMQIIDRQRIKLAIFERGAGQTQACGSAACAAVVAGIEQDLLSNEVLVEMPGGLVTVNWSKSTSPVFLTGPTVTVFRGHFLLSQA